MSRARRHRAHLLNPAAAFFGPVFQAEVRADGRRWRSYVRTSLYVLLLLAIVSLVFTGARQSARWQSGVAALQSVQQIAPVICITIAWVQFVALGLLTPALTGASLSRERSGRTLPALMTTPMHTSHILLGKLAGCSFQAVMLALLGLPLLLAIRVFGGLPTAAIIGFECLTLTVVVLGGACGLLASLSSTRVVTAMLGGLSLLAGTQILPPMVIAVIGELTAWNPGPLTQAASSCGVALTMLTMETLEPEQARQLNVEIMHAWLIACGLNLALAGIALGLASTALRRVTQREMGAPAKVKRRRRRGRSTQDENASQPAEPREAGRTREVGERPVLWRELRIGLFDTPRKLIGALIVILIVAAITFTDFRQSPAGLALELRFDEGGPYMFLAAAATIVTLIVAAATTATGVASEREAQTWDVLLTTRLSNRELIRSKAIGALRRQWFLPACLLGIFLIVGAIPGNLPPSSLAHFALVLAGPVVLLCATGQLTSLLCKRAGTAAAANLLVAVGLYFIVPLLLAMSIGFLDLDGILETPIGDALVLAHPVIMSVVAIEGAFRRGGPEYTLPNVDDLGPVGFTIVLGIAAGLYFAAAVGVLSVTVNLFPDRAPRVS